MEIIARTVYNVYFELVVEVVKVTLMLAVWREGMIIKVGWG